MVDGRGLVLVMRARRPPRQRDQARERAGRAVAAGDGGGDHRADRPARLHRPGRDASVAVLLDEGVGRGRLRRRREPRATSICAASSRAATSASSARDIRSGRGRRSRRRAPDHDRAGDRGRQHLPARHALLEGARRQLPRRAGRRAARSGWAPTGSAWRAIAAAAVEQFADERGISWPAAIAPFAVHLVGLGQARTATSASSPSALYETLRDGGRRGDLRRPRRRRGGEVRRRRAARRAAAPDRRTGRARKRRGRGAGPPRPRERGRASPVDAARRAASRSCAASSPERRAGSSASTAPARRRRRPLRMHRGGRGRSRTRSATRARR